MRVTHNIHFKAFKANVYGPDEHSPKAFGTIEMGAGTGTGYAEIYLHSEAECDELIKAACALKDLLHARSHAAAMAPLPDRGRYDAGSAAEVAQGLPAAMEQAYVNTGLNAVADLASTGLTYSDAALKLQAEIDAAVREVQP